MAPADGNRWKREGQRADNTWKDLAQGTKLTSFTRELENSKLGISSMLRIPLGMQTLFSLPFELFARNSWSRNCFFHILVFPGSTGSGIWKVLNKCLLNLAAGAKEYPQNNSTKRYIKKLAGLCQNVLLVENTG